MGSQYNVPDCVWIVVTMDDGTAFTIGAGWVLPPGYPNFSSTWIEMVGTEGAILVDDTHRDVYVTTMDKGVQFPISSMPGEKVRHVYAGPMEAETIHFLECVARDLQPLVTAGISGGRPIRGNRPAGRYRRSGNAAFRGGSRRGGLTSWARIRKASRPAGPASGGQFCF
jgi:predicted dehydrogenase